MKQVKVFLPHQAASDPIQSLFLCAVIVFSIKIRQQPNWMPAERHDFSSIKTLCLNSICDCPAETILYAAKRFVRDRIKSNSTNSGRGRVKHAPRFVFHQSGWKVTREAIGRKK